MFEIFPVTLQPGRDRSVRSFHPWIFSGGIAKKPQCPSGSLVRVLNSDNEVLGIGYYNTKNSLAIRMLSFKDGDPENILRNNLTTAIEARRLISSADTNSIRFVNAEGDSLPGLVVDSYNGVVVFQITTLGMDKLRAFIIAEIIRLLNPTAIVERSEAAARKEEGLDPVVQLHFGNAAGETEVTENGMRLLVDVMEGQKTGFFVDQREMRQLIKTLSADKKVLNCFAYSGGFSVAAALGGAINVTSVDISKGACETATRNLVLNGFSDTAKYPVIAADVFDFLRTDKGEFDIIILDPPAFVKRKENLKAALHGYRDINRIAINRLKPGGLLVTFSCSYYMQDEDFEACLQQAARAAGKPVTIISRHRRALDHPTALAHAEGNYLKGLALRVLG